MEIPGKVRIEYKKDGNVVQVYNSPTVCSLVINGSVVDAYVGAVANPFILKGKIESLYYDDIWVCAEMGLLFMTLYYDKKKVAKKFMGFG